MLPLLSHLLYMPAFSFYMDIETEDKELPGTGKHPSQMSPSKIAYKC